MALRIQLVFGEAALHNAHGLHGLRTLPRAEGAANTSGTIGRDGRLRARPDIDTVHPPMVAAPAFVTVAPNAFAAASGTSAWTKNVAPTSPGCAGMGMAQVVALVTDSMK